MQSPFEFSFAHFRTSRNVSPFRLRIKLCAGHLPVIVSPAPAFRGCTVSFACLGPLEIFPVMLRVPHFAPAAAFELPVLELAHDAADRFLLRLGLMSRHWLTSRNSVIGENRSRAGIGSRPQYSILFSRHFLASVEPTAAYLVNDGKAPLDRDSTSGVTNAANALERLASVVLLLRC